MSRRHAVGLVLEVAPQSWWLGWLDGPLVVEVSRVESYTDTAGALWAVVEGWRRLPDGGRRWSRDLVAAAAVPAELLAQAVAGTARTARDAATGGGHTARETSRRGSR